MFYSLGVF